MQPRRPPALALNVAAAPGAGYGIGSEDADPDLNDLGDSWKITHQGALQVLSKSQNAYHFTPDGFSKGNGADDRSGEAFCNVSEKDVRIIKHNIGAGASAVVQKGYLARLRRFVAIKKINAFERDKRRQLMNDIKALCEAQHPGIVSFLGAYSLTDSGQVALVLDYMDGGSLATLLQRSGSIPEPLLAKITYWVLQGLAYLHRRHTIHRDIKPANILINSSGEAKITDFGISATLEHTLANAKTYVGTSAYMSPERIKNQPYSFASDIWSLGLSILELGTGQFPYDTSQGPMNMMLQVTEEEPPIPPRGHVSDAFRDFVSLCLRKDPYARPPAEHLLTHPWIKWAKDQRTDDVANFVAPFLDPRERAEDLALQVVFDLNAVRESGQAGGPNGSAALRPLYHQSDTVVTYEGEVTRGTEAALARLEAAERMHGAFGGCSVDLRGLQASVVPTVVLGRDISGSMVSTSGSGSLSLQVIVHVEGTLIMRGAAGLGGAAASPFAECFIVRVDGPLGPSKITRQIFALHKNNRPSSGMAQGRSGQPPVAPPPGPPPQNRPISTKPASYLGGAARPPPPR